MMPCGDQKDCSHEEGQAMHTDATDHSDHQGDAEHCTPFCICSCCGQTYHCGDSGLVLVTPVRWAPDIEVSYIPSVPADILLPIWQPPKLV